MYFDLNSIYAASETSGAAMRRKRKQGKAESKLLATDGAWELYTPESWEAAIYLASLYSDKKAVWDFAYAGNDYYFNWFNKKGPFYIIVNKDNGDKYAVHIETDSFFDSNDRNMGGMQGLEDFCEDKPNIGSYLGVC